jgi:hypothetical protein
LKCLQNSLSKDNYLLTIRQLETDCIVFWWVYNIMFYYFHVSLFLYTDLRLPGFRNVSEIPCPRTLSHHRADYIRFRVYRISSIFHIHSSYTLSLGSRFPKLQRNSLYQSIYLLPISHLRTDYIGFQ